MNTLTAVTLIKQGNFSTEQADAIVRGIVAMQSQQATATHIDALRSELRLGLADLKVDLTRYMVTIISTFGLIQVGFITALLLKLVE